MYTNKTQNSENGSGKPQNYKQVSSNPELMERIVGTHYHMGDFGYSGRKGCSTVEVLADQYGVSQNAVRKTLKMAREGKLADSYGKPIEAYSRKRTDAEVQEVMELRAKGMSYKEIAGEMNRSKTFAYNIVKEHADAADSCKLQSNVSEKKSWYEKTLGNVKKHARKLAAAAGIVLAVGTGIGLYGCAELEQKAEGNKGGQGKLEQKAEEPAYADPSKDIMGWMNYLGSYSKQYYQRQEAIKRAENEAAEKAQAEKNKLALGQKQPEKAKPIKPIYTSTPAPAPRANEGEPASGATELAVEPRMGFDYTGLSGDVKGNEARVNFGARATSNNGSTYDFDFRYSNKDESWKSAQKDDVDKTTSTITPIFSYSDKNKSFLFKYNHVESDETMKNSSRNVDRIGENGLTITTTEGAQSEQKTKNSLDAFSFDTKVQKFRLFGDLVSNKQKTNYDEDSYALVEFSDPTIPPVLVNNQVGTASESTTNSYKLGAGWDFGNVEPGVIGRHNETKWNMNAELNGKSILDEKGSSSQDTLGVYSNFKFPNSMGRLTLLSNSGDDLDSSQKLEGAVHGNFLLGDKYVFGAGLERSDGGAKGRAAFLWKLNDSKTGQDALQSVENYMTAAENDNLFPEPTSKDQKRLARMERDNSAGADGFFLTAEGGKEGVDKGNYWRVDAAAPIPGTNGKGFVYGAYEDGDLEKRIEGGAGVKLGNHFRFTWNYFNSQDKDRDLNQQGTGPSIGVTW